MNTTPNKKGKPKQNKLSKNEIKDQNKENLNQNDEQIKQKQKKVVFFFKYVCKNNHKKNKSPKCLL